MRTGEKRLPSIPGMVPDLDAIPPGCPFADRCPFRQEAQARFRAGETAEDDLSVCDRVDPPLEEYAPGHFAACHYQRTIRKGGRG
jgi:ABC-type dipeptide/oligopeptide/nickel transport system ATPase component